MASKKIDHRTRSAERFKVHFPIGEAIATLLHPYAEVVLHDLLTGRIVQIWNSSTGRQAGDLSQLNKAADQFPKDKPVLGPYEKVLSTYGRTKSITAGLRDEDGQLIGFLCINLDITQFDRVLAAMNAFATINMQVPEPIFRNDLPQYITYLFKEFSLKRNKPVEKLSRAEKLEFMALIESEGLFQARNCVSLLAKTMNVSRTSIYNLLADLNS